MRRAIRSRGAPDREQLAVDGARCRASGASTPASTRLQLGLAVAVDPGDAEHLARAHLEVDVAQHAARHAAHRRGAPARRPADRRSGRGTSAAPARGRPWRRPGVRDGVVGHRGVGAAPPRRRAARSPGRSPRPPRRSRWVMITTARPSSARRRQTSSSAVASASVSTAVGSSSSRTLGVGVERPQDLQSLLLADGELPATGTPSRTSSPKRSTSAASGAASRARRRHQRARRSGQHEVLRRGQRRHEREVLLHERHAAVPLRAGRRGR